MAATRSKGRVTGRLPEDDKKKPSNLQRELAKLYQKNRQDTSEVAKRGKPPAPKELTQQVDELPYAEVRPLPLVEKGSQKLAETSDVVQSSEEELLTLPRLVIEPGFKNRAPLQADERAKDLIQEALRNPICITTEDLLNVSEPMRQELKKLLVKKRLEKKSVTFATETEPAKKGEVPEQKESRTISADKLPPATYEVLAEDTNGMAKGSVVVSDPVMQYLNTLAPGEEPKAVIVAAESHALRTVYPLINRVGEVESLLDPGSQIVSMSRAISVMLGVSWDPDITVQMQSANNTLARTLGLAKNVPFLFGTITVYLQIHVVENAAYKVLLGRPFDIITESIVRNARDGSQSLTLTDPNTGERCVMHTYERGKVPTILQRSFKADFQAHSRN